MIHSQKKYALPYLLLLLLVVFISSCNTTNQARSGKYSSANKRKANTYVTKEKKSNKLRSTSKNTKRTETVADASSSDMRASIVNYALQYKGTNYRYAGKSPDTGFDCSGFTGFVFSQNGIPVSGPSDKQAQMGQPKSIHQLMPGDLVFFGDKKKISHVGIVAARSDNQIQVVHATTSAGVRVDEILGSEYWNTRILYGRDLISK
ncbi:MAG: C40 family peptidase [Chitinophagales bacterium]|nr:C40 family peptidase [Chitinophagales bacterium]